MLVDIKHMERLHEVYMGEPGPTDVLAFPQDDLDTGAPVTGSDDVPEALLGDVVLCPQVADKQALTAGHSMRAELHLLCTHGILHLLGYDHADPEEEQEMVSVQTRLLEAWNTRRTASPHDRHRIMTGSDVGLLVGAFVLIIVAALLVASTARSPGCHGWRSRSSSARRSAGRRRWPRWWPTPPATSICCSCSG